MTNNKNKTYTLTLTEQQFDTLYNMLEELVEDHEVLVNYKRTYKRELSVFDVVIRATAQHVKASK